MSWDQDLVRDEGRYTGSQWKWLGRNSYFILSRDKDPSTPSPVLTEKFSLPPCPGKLWPFHYLKLTKFPPRIWQQAQGPRWRARSVHLELSWNLPFRSAATCLHPFAFLRPLFLINEVCLKRVLVYRNVRFSLLLQAQVSSSCFPTL